MVYEGGSRTGVMFFQITATSSRSANKYRDRDVDVRRNGQINSDVSMAKIGWITSHMTCFCFKQYHFVLIWIVTVDNYNLLQLGFCDNNWMNNLTYDILLH